MARSLQIRLPGSVLGCQWTVRRSEKGAGGPAETKTPGGGVSGGKRIQPLEPVMTAFQADVEFGSLLDGDVSSRVENGCVGAYCHDEPARDGPTICEQSLMNESSSIIARMCTHQPSVVRPFVAHHPEQVLPEYGRHTVLRAHLSARAPDELRVEKV